MPGKGRERCRRRVRKGAPPTHSIRKKSASRFWYAPSSRMQKGESTNIMARHSLITCSSCFLPAMSAFGTTCTRSRQPVRLPNQCSFLLAFPAKHLLDDPLHTMFGNGWATMYSDLVRASAWPNDRPCMPQTVTFAVSDTHHCPKDCMSPSRNAQRPRDMIITQDGAQVGAPSKRTWCLTSCPPQSAHAHTGHGRRPA